MSEVRLVVAILVPAIFTLILKDFFDLFMTNRYEGKVKQYTIWMLYFLLDTVISMNFKFVGVISMLYSFIILIAFCAVLYRDDIKYITLTVLFIICIGAASELIVALGIRAFLNSSQLQQFSNFWFYMFKTNYSDHSQNSETISRVWNKKIGLYELAC